MTNIEQEHKELVRKLVKPAPDIMKTLTPENVNLDHAAKGIVTEAGEFMSAVKKVIIYNRPRDLYNMIEELGDLEFYMEQARRELGVTRDETLLANHSKLSKRYKAMQYSDEAAKNREDKKES